MPAVLSRILRVALKPTISVHKCRDTGFGLGLSPGPLLWMTSVAGRFSLRISSARHPCISGSIRNPIGCSGSRSTSAHSRIARLWSSLRTDGLAAEKSASTWLFLSNPLPSRLKNRSAVYSSEEFPNFSGLPCLEPDNRPYMFSVFSSKVTEVSVVEGKDPDNMNDVAEVHSLKKEEEQRKRDEEVEKLRKEKEIEDKIGPPPEKPLPGDCCGNGCSPCIWDTYWEELADYKLLRKSVESSE